MLRRPAFKPSTTTAVPSKAYLIIFSDMNEEVNVVTLTKNMTLGRTGSDNTPDIAIPSPIVSRNHGTFTLSSGIFYYNDLKSLNGTFINGRLIDGDSDAIALHDGDVIRIDTKKPSCVHKNAVTMVFSTTYDRRSKWRRQKLSAKTSTIGRSAQNTIEFDSKKMRTQIARISSNMGQTIVQAPSGMNIILNNTPQSGSALIKNKDVLRFGNDFAFYSDNEICYSVCMATDSGLAVHINETIVGEGMGHKVLLKDIHMQGDRGDFTLIIGGSGAGKSTLINSILGKYTIKGSIILGGKQVTAGSSEASRIAYVPQTLPIRKEERLIDVVRDTALLRMNGNMSPKEREAFIMETLDQLGLKSKAKMEIKKLSGGEQRRAAIANEVVTNSDIFFLDEPDSGLDPKSGISLMNNLKALSDRGKIVMLISHNYASYPHPEKIYSKVIILAKSNSDGIGRLAFMGSIKEALEFFGVEELKDITKLINPVSENGDGRADEFVEKYRRMYGV